MLRRDFSSTPRERSSGLRVRRGDRYASLLNDMQAKHPVVVAASTLAAEGTVTPETALQAILFEGRRVRTELRCIPGTSYCEVAFFDPAVPSSFDAWGKAHHLTPGELAVLVELCQGGTNDAIAARLFLSSNTVRTHLNRIFRKLGTGSRLETVVLARSAALRLD